MDISHLSSAARQAARAEIASLQRILKSGEQIVDVCPGRTDGGRGALLVATGSRVLLVRRRRFFGARIETLPLAQVRSASDRAGVRHATVRVDAGGRIFELTDVDRSVARTFCARLSMLCAPTPVGADIASQAR